jgi:argininosuccinate synthase
VTARIVFAWSGAAEAWQAIAATAAEQGAEIVTLTLDLGQRDDLEEVRDRALAAGAVRAHVLDVREELARDYVLPALQANALQHDPMARRLASQLVSTKLEEIAAIEGATPAVDSEAIEDTLLGREGATYTLTKAPADAPHAPAHVEIAFERGVPRAVNGVPMALTELIDILTIIAGHHGVGRIGTIEAPAAILLIAAYARLANGSPTDTVSGTVRLKLFKGEHTVVPPS